MRSVLPYLALLCSCICFTSACSSPGTQKRLDASYGLAFSLSMDYGVASAYFPNGTHLDIAKVEGGPRYKDYLRNIVSTSESSSSTHKDAQVEDSFLGGVFKHLWPIKQPSNSPFTPMFKTLRAASESVLERPVSIAEIAVNAYPDNWQSSLFLADIDAALEDNSMEKLRPIGVNGELAARGQGIVGHCGEEPGDAVDPDRVVLSVENTRSGLTIIMWEEGCGVYGFQRVLHSPELGQDSLDKCEHIDTIQSCVANLEDAVRNVARMPLELPFNYFERVEAVVLLGEGAADARLNAVLRAILKEQYSGEAVDAMLLTTASDPAFLASREFAEWDYRMKSGSNEEADYQDRRRMELR